MNWGVRGEGFNLFLPKRKKLCVLFIKKKTWTKKKKTHKKDPFLTNCIIMLFV